MFRCFWTIIFLVTFASKPFLLAKEAIKESPQLHVHYLVGGLWNRPPLPIQDALEEIEAYFIERDPQFQWQVSHNFEWKKVCDDLKKLPKNDRIILIGQSWGAQAAIDISWCLEGRPVEAMLLFDLIIKSWSKNTNVVPDHVGPVQLFYQREDIFLRGKKCVERPDESEFEIDCHYQKASQIYRAHDWIVWDAVESGKVLEFFESLYL